MIQRLAIKKLAKSFGWRSKPPARVHNKYVFILCPPYCGSTLLSQILASSDNVSINNSEGTCEGQTLPDVRQHLFVKNRWDEKLQVDWPLVKSAWERYWDRSKPILLEKSPPNLLRAQQIETHFRPAYFFVMWRDPYAHCESQIRRNGNRPGEAAGFSIRCLKAQRRNIENLDHLLPIAYEELTADPSGFVNQANEFLPELGKLRTTGGFNVHNVFSQGMGIRNTNSKKIDLLDRRQLDEINSVFCHHVELLNYFGYQLLN